MVELKIVSDFPNYAVSKNGKVWSSKRQKFLKIFIRNGYEHIKLYKNNKKYSKKIHRLVLEVFIGACPDGAECCHNNGNKLDNRLSNLRWDTRSNNIKDAIRHGTHVCGEKHYFAKLTEQDVRMIIYMYRTGEFTQQEIAEIYNIGHVQIYRIVNKQTWKHIWRN